MFSCYCYFCCVLSDLFYFSLDIAEGVSMHSHKGSDSILTDYGHRRIITTPRQRQDGKSISLLQKGKEVEALY